LFSYALYARNRIGERGNFQAYKYIFFAEYLFNLPVLLYCILQRDEPIDEEIDKFVQPHIMAIGELQNINHLHIVCEGAILRTLPIHDICNAICVISALEMELEQPLKQGLNSAPYDGTVFDPPFWPHFWG